MAYLKAQDYNKIIEEFRVEQPLEMSTASRLIMFP
jgi:hypothetical protein